MSYGPYNMSVFTGYSRIYDKLKDHMPSLSALRYFRSVFYLVLKEECKSQKLFSQFLSGLVENILEATNNKPIRIDISKFLSVTLLYNLENRLNVLYNLPHKRQIRVTLHSFMKNSKIPVKVDVRTNKTTFPPNFVHHLDSLILFTLVDSFFKYNNSLSLGTNHDCFFTHVSNFRLLRKLYKKSFKSILVDPDLIFKKIALDNGLDEFEVLNQLHKLYVDKGYILDLSKSNHCISY